MQILSISSEAFAAIISAVCGVITAIAVPFFKSWLTMRKRLNKRRRTIDEIPNKLNEIDNKLTKCEQSFAQLNEQQFATSAQIHNLEKKYDRFETQQLKYIINDAFFGYDDITKIPDEVLINASQSCDIYIGKGLNHETGARCKLIYEELERRQRLKAHSQEEDKNE